VIGLIGNAGQVNYAASKAGLLGLTKSLARELAGRNITVNAIAPGFIATDMTSVLSDEIQKSIQERIPLKRIGSGEDIAAAVAFLASTEAAYITGQTLCVDGGMVM
jgi:3-oxoacyl-[acyl-carrier protein] reductase